MSAKDLLIEGAGPRMKSLARIVTKFVILWGTDTIVDTGTYEDPTSAPRGVTHVLVRRRFVVRSASSTSEQRDEVIRRGRASNSRGRPSRQ